jgi:hypothetical protein
MKASGQELSMKSMTIPAMLVFACIGWSKTASAQEYNLRTVPTIPQAGAPFVAAFDSTECVAWVLPPQGEPTVVTVQGSLVHLEVDRISIVNCSYPLLTNTLNVPALPAGTYQLELIGRAYLSPGNDLLVQTITFEVGPAVTISPYAIPANNKIALSILAGLMLGLTYMLCRRRG